MEAALLAGPLAAALGALLFGWFWVRLSGVYLAMLTLACAQILWALIYQWDDVTGGSNGLIGLWPSDWLATGPAYYYATLVLCMAGIARSEEHTSELQSLMRISYAVFCLKKKTT